jgi:hypothetical protein
MSPVQKGNEQTIPSKRRCPPKGIFRDKTSHSFDRAGSFPGDPQTSRNSAYLHSNLPNGDYIRLLELAPGSSTDPISIRLCITELRKAPEYSAVSYVWGDSRVSVPIECQGDWLNVTVNLRDALVRVRQRDAPMTLWADAVCINQVNLQERGHQVSLMGAIYRKAKSVLVCLGPDQDEGALNVTTLLEEVDTLISRYPSIDCTPALKANDSLYSDPRWASLRTMLEHPWFYRTWVIQEVGLASHPRVLYGNLEFEYGDLMRLGSWARECAVHLYSWINLDLHITWSQNWRSTAKGQANTFLDLLTHTRGLGCADPRDHVYAFLGHPLARLDDGSGTIVSPDYQKYYLDGYLKLAGELLGCTRGLRILSAVEHTDDTVSQGFPSWVPRWNMTRTLDSLGIDSRHYYEAVAGADFSPHDIISDSVLRVRGVVIDRVGQSSQLPFIKAEDGQDMLDEKHKHRREAALLAVWQDLSNRSGPSPYPSNPCMIAFSHTLTAGMFDNQPAEDENNFPSHQDDFASFWTHHCQDSREYRFPELQEGAARGDRERFRYAMRLACAGRNFISTEKGWYGLAPCITQQSDLCCVIYGTKVLYILRKTDKPSHFKLVGEAYIHGFMRGEVVDLLGKGEFEEEEIILC